MIKGIGIDLIELKRIKQSIIKNDRLAERILTIEEMAVFKAFASEKRQVEYLAGRFAAKEACAKALGTGIGKVRFEDIEILADDAGAPQLTIKGYPMYRCFISITHTSAYAAAYVVLEKKSNA